MGNSCRRPVPEPEAPEEEEEPLNDPVNRMREECKRLNRALNHSKRVNGHLLKSLADQRHRENLLRADIKELRSEIRALQKKVAQYQGAAAGQKQD